jgi:UDP-galactopyranose mutase
LFTALRAARAALCNARAYADFICLRATLKYSQAGFRSSACKPSLSGQNLLSIWRTRTQRAGVQEKFMRWNYPLIVFSHLRWSWVYQRPQHLLSRLAARRRVFFIEEPVQDAGAYRPYWRYEQPARNILVCQPQTPNPHTGFDAPELASLLIELVRREDIQEHVVWMYTPMALPLARRLTPHAVVYDCMDELSAFRNAPPELVQREHELFGWADVVFTGGPSLYEAKRGRHPRVHCFPSSVDLAHFGRARGAAVEPPDQAGLPRPRLGFFGVIDERLDRELVGALAEAHPEWQIIMVGPITKIDPATLPRHPNLHYLGQRPYEALPGYLQGWDACLLPFSRNQATRYISPTKTLEYMAAEKPIISTPIHDVAQPYGEIVYLGETAEQFIAACGAALAESAEEHARRVAAMRQVLARTSWDNTVAAMEELIQDAVFDRQNAAALASVSAAAEQRAASAVAQREVQRSHELVIIGAGPTGLSAAYHAGPGAVLLEKEASIGGWCRSFSIKGFTFDYAGHIMFSNDPYVHELYEKLLGSNVHWQDREAWVYSKNVYTRYPFQGALYGLPPEVIKECLVGAIEARFGSLKGDVAGAALTGGRSRRGNGGGDGWSTRSQNPSRRAERICAERRVSDCCADGVLESTARLVAAAGNDGDGAQAGKPANFEEFIYRVWGTGIARHFAIPYNRKLWAVPLSEIETSWLGGRVPLPDLEQMIEGALHPTPKPMGPNARFGYPLRGGFQALLNGFLPYVSRRLRLNSAVLGISPGERLLTLATGEQMRYQHLISTMPLPVLVRMMGDEVPPQVRQAAAGLRHVSVRCVHIGVGREKLTDKHWVYYPEDTVFHRIFVQGNASPHCNPPGGFGITCEITYCPTKPLPCEGDALVEHCVADCRRVGLIGPDDPILVSVQCDLPYAYVVYDHARAQNMQVIREWLNQHDVFPAGRYGEWEYYNSDHAFLAGKKAVEAVCERQRTRCPARAPLPAARLSPARASTSKTAAPAP